MKKFVAFILSCSLLFACAGEENTAVTNLKCNNLVNPEGVDKVEFSWEITSSQQNVVQTAWEIEIASSSEKLKHGEADVWKSGKTVSDKQLFIEPEYEAFISENKSFKSGDLYYWRMRAWNGVGEVTAWSRTATFSVGPQTMEAWGAKWITAEWPEGSSQMPYFRKAFDISAINTKAVRAIVYLCGLGCSDLYFNGKLVDESRMLDPAQSDYEQFAFYSTFNVTSMLKQTKNCIGLMPGTGWYSQDLVWGKGFSYGKPMFILRMEITYDNGSKIIYTTDESWTWSPGPVLRTNIYAGEIYDARKAMTDWSSPDADCTGWRQAVAAESETEISSETESGTTASTVKASTGVIPPHLRSQIIEPVRLQKEIKPVKIWQNPDSTWIFDFGVNVSAVPRIRVKQPRGVHLKMRMGEILNADRTIDFNTTGVPATGVIQTDEYICSGDGTETWTPRFTYHGFRYLELSRVEEVEEVKAVKASEFHPDESWISAITVHTDVQQIGEFICSDPQINRLHEIAIRTMLSNIHGLPTDCPHRERCGWLGDAHTVAPFENMNYGMNNFWEKYMDDIASTSSVALKNTLHQKLHNSEFYFADKVSGIPFMIAPGRRLCGVASPDWGTAVVQLPWFTCLYFGNDKALARHYPQMKQWVDHIDALAVNHIVPYGLGDWCPPGGNATIDCPIPLSSTAFHYYDAALLSLSAQALGKTEDAAFYADLKDAIGQALVDTFYCSETKTFGSQTANTMALYLGFAPPADRQSISDAIVKDMQAKNDFFHVGIFGMGRIGQALSSNGNASAAWKTFTKQGEHSFEWMWTAEDATTLWEVLPVSRLSADVGRVASLNHPMLGGYDAWFYEDIAGISPHAPGYKVIRFEPRVCERLDWAKATIHTPYGIVASEWSHTGGKLIRKITIPPNTSGIIKCAHSINNSTDLSIYPTDTDGFIHLPSGNYIIKSLLSEN
ncbi:MAG: glycoside hydrolase family 78 protein [Tannerella sp.]|jgi:alpha-L-rhamnosidase|nr:glycoside hydrolase family 78 protein [Tannerella sp.]